MLVCDMLLCILSYFEVLHNNMMILHIHAIYKLPRFAKMPGPNTVVAQQQYCCSVYRCQGAKIKNRHTDNSQQQRQYQQKQQQQKVVPD